MSEIQETYYGKRRTDERCERVCAAYADRYLFSRLHYMEERITGRDAASVQLQKTGGDLVLRNAGGKVIAVIDEKAKVRGHLNDVITFPSFEIVRRPAPGTHHTPGWFAHPVSCTTHYAMISVATDRQVEKGHEHELSEGDITCMVYALVSKKELTDWVKRETFKSIREIEDDARNLVFEWNASPNRPPWGAVKVYREDWRGKYLYLKLSADKDGQPVNLVIRRDVLRNAELIHEIYVDGGRVMRYTPPKLFAPLGERLAPVEQE